MSERLGLDDGRRARRLGDDVIHQWQIAGGGAVVLAPAGVFVAHVPASDAAAAEAELTRPILNLIVGLV